jgi:hypothetical protein
LWRRTGERKGNAKVDEMSTRENGKSPLTEIGKAGGGKLGRG